MNAIKMKRILINICKYVLLIFAAFVALVPIVSCIFTAFKTEEEYASTNVITLPKNFLNFDNFIIAWNKANMGKAFLNSFIILICVLVGSIMISAMLAYVLNRFKFPGNKLIRNLFTIATQIPGIASQVTVYQIMTALHLVNSMPGYIILMMGTDVITIYIFLQFFENLSPTLDESAILDGCTYFGVFFKILLPLLRPAIVASAILGVVSALYRDRWPDQVIRIFSIACIATPSFWLSVLFILLFSSTLHLLPASGALPALTQDPGGWLARMAMPGIALAVPLTGQLTRIIRTSMVEELDKDYVRTARGFGIPYGTVVARNVLRNALITPVTVLGLKFGYMIGGAVVLEVIFALPGMGMAIVSGVTSNYVMLVQGVVLVVAITFIIVNVIVDMLYILIDPRIRTV